MKEKARWARLNSDTQEVVELTKILHSKLLLQRGDDALKQLLTGAWFLWRCGVVQRLTPFTAPRRLWRTPRRRHNNILGAVWW